MSDSTELFDHQDRNVKEIYILNGILFLFRSTFSQQLFDIILKKLVRMEKFFRSETNVSHKTDVKHLQDI